MGSDTTAKSQGDDIKIYGKADPSVGLVAIGTGDRELNIAAEWIEEAVMWAVKHITR